MCFGDVMNVARARICDLAGPRSVYVDESLTARVSTPNLVETRVIAPFAARKAANLEVHEYSGSRKGDGTAPSESAREEGWAEVSFGVSGLACTGRPAQADARPG